MKEIRRKIQVLEDLNKIEQHCWGGNQDMKELDCGQMGAKAQKIWEIRTESSVLKGNTFILQMGLPVLH